MTLTIGRRKAASALSGTGGSQNRRDVAEGKEIMRKAFFVKAGIVASLIAGGGALFGVAVPASAATVVGTPNLTSYCQSSVGSVWYAQTFSLTSPYAWRCTNSYTHGPVGIDVNKACRQQFGANSSATVVSNDPNGWRCVR